MSWSRILALTNPSIVTDHTCRMWQLNTWPSNLHQITLPTKLYLYYMLLLFVVLFLITTKSWRSFSPCSTCPGHPNAVSVIQHCLPPSYQPKSDTMSLRHQSILWTLRFVKPSHSSLPIVKPPHALRSLSWIFKKPTAFVLYIWITRRYTILLQVNRGIYKWAPDQDITKGLQLIGQ